MTGWGVLNAAMLVGLLGAAVPVVIHLLNRRRDPIVDWGAMQFLEIGRKARQKIRLTELLLMLARMALLAVVALALARPYRGGASNGADASGGEARDVVLVIDGSAGMGRAAGGKTPRERAIGEARALVKQLKAGDSVAVLVAGDRVRAVVDPPSFDHARVDATLAALTKPGLGASDIPAALGEAFRILEKTGNPAREVVVITDGLRSSWHLAETGRWALIRDLRDRLPVPPRVWALTLGGDVAPDGSNGSVGPVELSRALLTPGLPLTVTSEVQNAGPGPLTRTAELLVDGLALPGSAQVVGPVPEGGRAPLVFKTSLSKPGSHLLSVRLVGGADALASDDEMSAAVEVAEALPVLLVDGEPSRQTLGGEVDFLRAALAPTGDATPQVKTTVVPVDGLNAPALQGQNVLILANVERLSMDQSSALARWLDAGGGILVAPGDQVDMTAYNTLPWLPAKLGELTGDFAAARAVAHPAPSTFTGPVFPPFARGETPPLASATLFAYRRLDPSPNASVSARLDTGEPWAVERLQGKGRVLLLSGPLDAEGGTLPVNPDFVPLCHEWVFHLAGGLSPHSFRPGEPVVFDLSPVPNASVTTLPLLTPSGETVRAVVTRTSGLARARYESSTEPGVYRLELPDPPGGYSYATVASDAPPSLDTSPLTPSDLTLLTTGWPLHFEPDPARLPPLLFSSGPTPRRELWRWLVFAALGALCVEIYLTRKLVKGQGSAEA